MTSGASIFRAQENTKGPLIISVISNVMNIVGNAILIWGFNMGVAGVCHCNSGFKDLLCSCCTLAVKEGQTAYCSQGLSEDTSGS